MDSKPAQRVLASSTIVLLIIVLSAGPISSHPSKSPARPNIMIILTDDQRWDSLDQMPALDAAAEWTHFSNAYVDEPQCCPSRASILTGRYPQHTGVETLPQDLSVIKTFGAEEDAHVAALHGVAGGLGTPAPKPTGKFPIHNAAQVTELAASVENLGAAAYLGQASRIKSKEILAAALSIHSIEARHAATMNLVLKKSPTPTGAFATPASMSQVLAAVKPFIA